MNSMPLWLGAVLSALVMLSIFLFSDRFSRNGLRGWKTALFGMTLVFLSFLSRAVMTIESFNELFIPGIPEFVSQMSQIIVAVGAAVTALSIFVAVRKLSFDREAEQQKESDLQFLDNLRNIIFEPYTLVEVLNFSLKEVSRTLGDIRAVIFIHNPSRKELYLTSSVQLDRKLESSLERVSIGADIVSRTQRTGRSHAVGRLADSDRATQELFSGAGIESAMAAPLMSRHGSVGVMLVLGESPYQFTRRESEVLDSAANLLGPVVASFRMEREIRQLNEQVGAVANRSRSQQAILAVLDTDSTPYDKLGVLLEQSEQILKSDGVVLASEVREGEWRVIRSTDDSSFDETIPDTLTRRFGNTIENRKPVMVRTSSSETGEVSRYLLFPVGREESVRGILVAAVPAEREKFTSDEISRMQLVLKLAGLLLPLMQKQPRASDLDDRELAKSLKSMLISSSRSELSESLERIVYGAASEYDAGMAMTYEEGRQFLRVTSSFGYDGTRVNDFRLKADGGPWGEARKTDEGQSYDDKRKIEELFLSLAGDELSWFMERSGTRKLPSYCSVIPLKWRDREVGVLFLEGADDAPDLIDENPLGNLVIDLIAFKLMAILGDERAVGVSDRILTGHNTVDNLNQVNNALTGIIGKAQLLGFGLKDERLPERDSVLLNLDMIADEAFQAGELIKELQREIRDEKPPESDNEAADISSMLNQLAIVRYGSDPNLHYLRENPGVSFVADLSSVTPVSGAPSEIKPLLGEVLQWMWDEFDIDDHIRIKLLDRGDHSYLISSDRSFTDDDLNIDNLAFRPLGMHPDLSSSEAVAGLSTASVSFCERSTEDGDRILYLRFEKTKDQSTDRNNGSLNILAIDDQEIIRELLTGMLDQLGYNVTVCSTGAEGVEVFNAGVYDLIITDIGLPDLDGWQVVEKVRAADPDVPVIMISGWGLDEEVEKAGEYGVDHILPKPFRLENLSELIEKVKARRATA